ncbi:AbiH family protein [Flavobacterium sp. RNTU_13]|uniref:AbiH family protein n=1 Tax=Flavobacterium sp. RNTU_13 TaxID=3375145 RepID=UPI003987650A
MNKLVIIGNGFDLAHGLPTSYGDFINWFWSNLRLFYKDESIKKLVYVNEMNYIYVQYETSCFADFVKNLKEYCKTNGHKFSEQVIAAIKNNLDTIFEFRSDFFKLICKNHSIQNWVDIENEYYRLLKDCLKENDNTKVKKLNEEFEQVKNLLERYLKEEVDAKYNFENTTDIVKISDIFNHKFQYQQEKRYIQEFSNAQLPEIRIRNRILKSAFESSDVTNFIFEKGRETTNYFLNFNYTQSLSNYLAKLINNDIAYFGTSHQIQIHGRLNDPNNKINFGFGDEMDDHYKQIEEKNDNEYLKYIKSFQYLQNSNYKKVLDFIDGDSFQVYIMGHSCGLSDRILLNTIFEHTNCVSIKVFYHQRADGSDNYTEIVQNISRHFNKKKMMRDKIVNKSLCQKLPQNIRFEKLNTP